MAYYQTYKSNKYKNVKQEYNGVRFDSGKEASKAFELDMRIKAKDIKGWKTHIKIPINVYFENGLPILTDIDGDKLKKLNKEFYHICNYYIDFVIEHNDGSIEYLEIKSPITMTPVWKLKWKMCECIYKDHPTIFLTVEC